MDQTRILIADDHQLFLDGICSLLKEYFTIDTAKDGKEAIRKIEQNQYDVVLLDISMPGADGMEVAGEVKKKWPDVKILILTTYNDFEIIKAMIQIGVSGYLLKNSTRQELIEAILLVKKGNTYFSSEIRSKLISDNVNKIQNKTSQKATIFTEREIEIVRLLAKEFTNERIASTLSISCRTVETHRKNMMHKTDSHNLAGLLRYAYNTGLLPNIP